MTSQQISTIVLTGLLNYISTIFNSNCKTTKVHKDRRPCPLSRLTGETCEVQLVHRLCRLIIAQLIGSIFTLPYTVCYDHSSLQLPLYLPSYFIQVCKHHHNICLPAKNRLPTMQFIHMRQGLQLICFGHLVIRPSSS